MKSLVENAKINFRCQLAQLKAITGWSNEDLAKVLGCTAQTISNAYSNPLSVKGNVILMVQEYLRREDRKRYE